MIRDYLRSAWRNITKHKFISFINIFGLTTGLTCCLLILVYIINELSYDKFNTKADRIYRVTRIFYSGKGEESLHLSAVAPPFGPLLKNAFPDIEKVTRMLSTGTIVFRYKEKMFNEQNAFFADENFMSVFSLDMVKGNKQTALVDPYNVMLTPELARKYFGSEDPINKTVILDNTKHEFKVTGVFNPFPANSHMHPDILVSFNTLKDSTIYGEKNLRTNFGNNAFYTYLLLPELYNASTITKQLNHFLDRDVHMQGMPPNLKTSEVTKLTLQKLTDIHLTSHLDDEIEPNGDIKRVYIFSVIAAFILLIACINYMNLATARSSLRAKEIGVRKAIGAHKRELIKQFLSESVFIAFIALVFALVLTWSFLPYINVFAHLNLSLTELTHSGIPVIILLIPLVIGLLSGIYPALFISSFNPVKVLKGTLKVGTGNLSLRKVLVILQFSISIILIVATAVVFQQLRYIQNKSLGFNKDFVVTTIYPRSVTNQYESFRQEMLKNPAVVEIGRSSRIPSGRLLDEQGASIIKDGSLAPVNIDLKYITADYGFIPAYSIKMAAGRNFSKAFSTDTSNYIINETAVQQLGWKSAQSAIGKDLKYGNIQGKIIGVVNDFHFESLHQKIIPLVFLLPSPNKGRYGRMSIKINGQNITSALSSIENTWHKYVPNVPFDYTFLDDRFKKLYDSEQQQSYLFTIFSVLAIFIACLGLFGLSAFTISQRVKEIGIRKVLGATVQQIVMELSSNFLKLVLLSAVIALPVAWLFMRNWLQQFAFRVELSWWIFLTAGLGALIIAFGTISSQAVKAAMTNPVKSLRNE